VKKTLATGLASFTIVYAVIRFTALSWQTSEWEVNLFVAIVAAPLAVLLGRYMGRLTLRGVGLCSLAYQVFMIALVAAVYAVAAHRGVTLSPSISSLDLQQHVPAIVGSQLIEVLSPVVWLWAIQIMSVATLESVLGEIAGGKTLFTPAGQSEEDIESFQRVAKILEYANTHGLLDGYASHRESYTGHRWYVRVMVKNGLSYAGQQRLQSPPKSVEDSQEEILQLKPNFHGMGIDLKALWRRLRR
jgi:hypothetical protein